MRVCDPEWVVRIVAHSVWSRRRAILYAVSAASLAGNFIVLAGSLGVWGALAGCGLLFYDLLPQLLQLCELLMHRSVLYILLNLILLRVMVKSGVLSRVAKPDDSLEHYHIASRMQWPATFHVAADAADAFPDMETRSPAATSVRESPAHTASTRVAACTEPAVTCSLLPTNSPVVPEGATSSPFASLDIVLHGLKDDQKKERCIEEAVASIKEPKAAQLAPDSTTFQQTKRATSLFTIEPLEMVTDQPPGATQLVGGGQSERPDQLETSPDEDANTVQNAVPVPLRKVGSRAAMLAVHDLLDSMQEEACGRPHVDENESLELVKTYDSDDNELSRQEFNQRVDTFICKFKRNLTMQRKDSLNRLLGLVGGGEIRLIK